MFGLFHVARLRSCSDPYPSPSAVNLIVVLVPIAAVTSEFGIPGRIKK